MTPTMDGEGSGDTQAIVHRLAVSSKQRRANKMRWRNQVSSRPPYRPFGTPGSDATDIQRPFVDKVLGANIVDMAGVLAIPAGVWRHASGG